MYEQRPGGPFHGGFSWTESGDRGNQSIVVAVEADLPATVLGVDAQVMDRLRLEEEPS
jgi:hypothetical protein